MPQIVIKKVSSSQPLLTEPRNDSDQVVLNGLPLRVFAGEKVKTGTKDPVTENVNGVTITWVFAEATSGLNVDLRKGFVDDEFLDDENADVPEVLGLDPFPKTVTKAQFADSCYVHAELNNTNPAYLYALAFVQSGSQWGDDEIKTNDAVDALAFGAYQFTKGVWANLLKLAELNDLTAVQIKFPTAQCVVAGVLASKSATLLKGLITDRALSAVDLYLTFLFADDNSFGSNAAAKILEGEKQNAAQTSIGLIKQIYADDAVRSTFLKRNKAIFKEDGSATIAQALKACSDALAAGFEEVRKLGHQIQGNIPAHVDGPIFGGQFAGQVISVSDRDVDALARVGESEVGNFGAQFGNAELTRALGGVIDTVFNRSIYPTTEFPKTIQDVINQKQQFSAINDIGTWEHLPKAPQDHFDIVLGYVQGRARGAASEIKGATHFFNPDTSNPSWGGPIREHPTAQFGRPRNSHIHGFPDGYHPPEGYAIQLGKDGMVFTGDGKPLGALITPDKSVAAILAAAVKEWEFWGNSTPGHVAHKDTELAFATYVVDAYCKPLSVSTSASEVSSQTFFWSAVAVSFFLKQAGVKSSEFTFSARHSVYIREAIKARNDQDKSKAYWGFRLSEPEAVVEPGDIIGRGRTSGMTFAQAQALFDRHDDYEGHSDVVVAVKAGVAELIGGNVSNTVMRRTIALDRRGKVADKASLAFVVMKKN
jgi:hypothetical protein